MKATIRELRALVLRIERYAHALGIIDKTTGEFLGLDEGSQTYGRAWRLYCSGRYGTTGHSDPFGLSSGYLGWTKSEALLSLRALEAGLWVALLSAEKREKAREADAKAREAREAEATSHGKPADEMRQALRRLAEIVEGIDLDQPLTI